MKDCWMKKGLVVSIILLFIGVAIAPSINFTVVKASNDNDLVEVTTQACGINGYGNSTVKLTKQQYQNLEQYLVDFRARLNQTTTKEEAAPIFKEAAVELNKYELLPKGMSVEQTQRLVTGPYQNTKLMMFLEKILDKSKNLSLQEGNAVCLIYGENQGHTYFQGFVMKTIYHMLVVLDNILYFIFDTYINRVGLFELILLTVDCLVSIEASMSIKLSEKVRNSPQIGSMIYYGYGAYQFPFEPYNYSSEGTLWTAGLFGIKNWSGQFYGKLPLLKLIIIDNRVLYNEVYFPGVGGFTGLRVSSNSSNFYYGFALSVNVGPEPPEINKIIN